MKRHRSSMVLRLISAIVLCFFTWSFGGVFDIAYAVNNSQKSKVNSQQSKTVADQQPKKQGPEEKFQKTVEAIEQILDDTSNDTDTKKNKLRGKRTEIEFYDTEIRKQFTATENKLKNEGLPSEILERHYKFVRHYDDNLKELKNNLDDIEKAKTKSEADAAIGRAKAHLEKVKPPKKHVPLDPNKLPHRTAEPVFIEPRTSPEQFTEGKEQKAENIEQKQKRILVASNGSLNGLLNSPIPDTQSPTPVLLALADPPTSADLAETIEVKFTPAIQAKAAELGHNPTKIYNWVRNNIEYVPTYGSIQGADMCLQTKQCNDFDTASLLIALLRTSGISVRYAYGTIEIPVDKFMNWAGGFTDANSAMTLMASGGIPGKGLTSGGKVVAIQMEHVWVESWIDYIPSRGEIHRQGDTWIPLDASFKQYTYIPGIDIKSAVPFDVQAFTDQIKATATIDEAAGYVMNVNSGLIRQSMQGYQTGVQNYITQNYPNATVGDVLGKKEIVKQEFPHFLGTLPYRVMVKGAHYSTIPDNLRHKLSFIVKTEDDFNYTQALTITRSMAELAGKRITLNYLPASGKDADVLALYGYYSAPPYLVNLKPVLFIEGVQEAVGGIVGMGNIQSLEILFQIPGRPSDRIKHTIHASAMVAIGFDSLKIPASLLENRKAKLESAVNKLGVADVGFDDIIGEILNLHAISYFSMLEMFNKINSQGRIGYSKQIAEMAAMINPSVEYLYGVPYRVINPNLMVDVKRYVMARQSLSGNRTDEINFMFQTGLISSALEHGVFELFNEGGKAVSSIKILSEANNSGIPIYTIRAANSSAIQNLEVLPETLSDIRNAIAAGKEVIVPQRSVQYYQWGGDGYIVFDPKTGAGSFLITGGLLGGSGACNIPPTDFSKVNIFEYLKHGSYVTLGGATETCKNYAYDLIKLCQQTRDQLLMWAAKAEEVSPEVARALTRYALTMGTLTGALIQITTNWDKIGQLNPVNQFFAGTFIACLSFLTAFGLVWTARAGAQSGSPGLAFILSVELIVISNEAVTLYLDWLLSMQQTVFIDRRRDRYANLEFVECEYPA